MEHKTRIKGNVHYVGVNDRNKHRFEGMWPVSYTHLTLPTNCT